MDMCNHVVHNILKIHPFGGNTWKKIRYLSFIYKQEQHSNKLKKFLYFFVCVEKLAYKAGFKAGKK